MFAKAGYKTETNSELPDYRIYRLSKKEVVQYMGEGFCIACLVLYFFYHSVWAVCFGIPGGILFCKWKKQRLCEKRKHLLEQQFKDWIRIVSSGLQAGNSVENAFLKSGKEIQSLYGKEADIWKEFIMMERLLKNNITLEKILWDFGERSGSEDISHFAEVFFVGKRSGGNLREMIESCCEIIVAKMEVEKEIQTLIHGKVTEQKIMCLIPFGIMLYISITSPGYFSPLYHNVAGICIMTGCLLVYVLAVLMSLKIVRIGV